MPTARELLEQADALMRRNRTDDFEPDIPELTDEVSIAGHGVPARGSPKSAPVTPGVQRGRVDVPASANIFGGIEEPSIQSLPEHGGEDSRWLDFDLGAASVTGPAPDSIAVVPPSTMRSPRSAPKPGAQPMPVAESRAEPSMAPPPALAIPAGRAAGTLSDQPAETPPASDPGFDAMLGVTPAVDTPDLDIAPLPVPVAAQPVPDEPRMPEPVVAPVVLQELAPIPVAPIPEAPMPAPEEAAPMPAPEEVAPMPAPEEAAPPETYAPEPVIVPDTVAAAEAVAASVPDAQHWEGLAEEIRMQVLQRIDIFTDTGLHGELAARLQPIVDRASADLVTTINREVGQILRAYVAEAIEREIEKWRQANP